MKILKACLTATMLVSAVANAAAGLQTPDFSKWASKVLNDDGITDARIVQTKYPFDFTYCRKDSLTLWHYTVMSAEHLEAIRKGEIVKPIPAVQRSVAIESNSTACNDAS